MQNPSGFIDADLVEVVENRQSPVKHRSRLFEFSFAEMEFTDTVQRVGRVPVVGAKRPFDGIERARQVVLGLVVAPHLHQDVAERLPGIREIRMVLREATTLDLGSAPKGLDRMHVVSHVVLADTEILPTPRHRQGVGTQLGLEHEAGAVQWLRCLRGVGRTHGDRTQIVQAPSRIDMTGAKQFLLKRQGTGGQLSAFVETCLFVA